MKKILLTNHYEGKPLEIVSSVIPEGFQLIVLPQATNEELLKYASEADYFLVSGRLKISKDILDNATGLKMIQRTGVGLDVFDFDALKNKNIPLYVNQGVNAQSVSEHALLLILSSLRKLNTIDRDTKSGIWKKQQQGLTTHELSGKTVGIVGMGNIGKKLARMLNAFDAKVIYYDAFTLPQEVNQQFNMQQVTLDQLYKQSDIISLHCPLTDATRHMICKETISQMKDGVIIVNTARGPLINEDDLVEGLESGKIGYCGIDVYEVEPPVDSRLFKLNNTITTPHIAGVTYESFANMMKYAMRNIELFELGKLDEIEEYKFRG